MNSIQLFAFIIRILHFYEVEAIARMSTGQGQCGNNILAV